VFPFLGAQERHRLPPVTAEVFNGGIDVKKIEFLLDIDDEVQYAKQLELLYALAFEEIGKIMSFFPILETRGRWIEECFGQLKEVAETYDKLAKMRATMALLLRDMDARRKRLADSPVGLSDVELDEAGT